MLIRYRKNNYNHKINNKAGKIMNKDYSKILLMFLSMLSINN